MFIFQFIEKDFSYINVHLFINMSVLIIKTDFFFLNCQDDDDDEDEIPGNFFNDLYSVMIENERATWNKLELSGKKDPTKKDKITEETMVNTLVNTK